MKLIKKKLNEVAKNLSCITEYKNHALKKFCNKDGTKNLKFYEFSKLKSLNDLGKNFCFF